MTAELVEREWGLSPEDQARWGLEVVDRRVFLPITHRRRPAGFRCLDLGGVAPAFWSLAGPPRRYPWPLDGVRRAREVWIAQDEPDALLLRRLGLVAVTLLGSWTSWGPEDARRWRPVVRGRRVRLFLEDLRQARKVGQSLTVWAKEVRVLDPDLPLARVRVRAAVLSLGWDLFRLLALAERTPPLC